MIASTKGLTTISPTWFHVADTAGNLTSIASAEYVNYAHQSNIEVWAAIRDFDGGISSQEESLALLSSTTSRTNLINQLMSAVFQTGVDGINVDFEMISEECGEHYIQFIRELSVQCRKNNIVLSWTTMYPRITTGSTTGKSRALWQTMSSSWATMSTTADRRWPGPWLPTTS